LRDQVVTTKKKKGVSSAEWGSVGNIRFMLSSRGSITTNASLLGADIYNMFVTGYDSYGIIEQTSQSSAFIYHPLGHGDDPLELRQTCGARFAEVPKQKSGHCKFSLIDLEVLEQDDRAQAA